MYKPKELPGKVFYKKIGWLELVVQKREENWYYTKIYRGGIMADMRVFSSMTCCMEYLKPLTDVCVKKEAA